MERDRHGEGSPPFAAAAQPVDRRRAPLVSFMAVAFVIGCQGNIADPNGNGNGIGSGNRPGNGSGNNPGGPPGAGAQPTACMGRAAEASVLHARMLSPRQYDNTVQDLLKVAGSPAKDFGGGTDTQLDDVGAERRANAAASIAHQAVAQLATWSPCAATAADCKQQIIDKVGQRAFRHALSATERQQLTTLFDAGMNGKDFTTGVEWFLTGVLQAPDFLYQSSRPAPGEQAGTTRAISGDEMASRLSYFVWDSMPDDALLAAASTPSGLADTASVQQQLTRMLQDQPRLLRGVTSFYSNWLALDGFGELARDDKAFTTAVAEALG